MGKTTQDKTARKSPRVPTNEKNKDKSTKKPSKPKKTPSKTPSKTVAAGGIRKKHRFRPGTKALQEIRKLQSGKDKIKRAIPKASIARLIREILGERGDYRITANALDAFRESSEYAMVQLFQDTQRITCCSNRVMPTVNDMRCANQIRNNMNSCASTLSHTPGNDNNNDEDQSLFVRYSTNTGVSNKKKVIRKKKAPIDGALSSDILDMISNPTPSTDATV